ncbi:histidine phosphatase family protein [Thermocatellispora tengchongensis]|uniref:histidine phosphatase family protein n=1 Tax=Thermocatellispora tengchongensis TaxID=1073253 RepID=UPI003643A3E1
MPSLILVRHASTPAMRAARFPAGERADPAGLARAAGLAGTLPEGRWFTAPEPAARETAEALAPGRAEVVPELAVADPGRWRGLPYADVALAEPDALRRWREGPAQAPPGGESDAEMARRVAAWLEKWRATAAEPAVACCDAGPIRAALGHVLGLTGAGAFDLAPLSLTELSATPAGWRVRRVNHRPEPGAASVVKREA